MELIEIVAQTIGIVAMAFNILSFQGKKQSTVIALQLFGGALFAVNYLMLGAAVGGLLNIIAVVRAVVFLFRDKLKADRLPWLIVFVAAYISVYILSFTVFGKELNVQNLLIEILPVVGMTALNIGYRRENASDIRNYALISSPSWLVYNIAAGSWGAIICEILNFTSILIGIFRLDKKKRKD